MPVQIAKGNEVLVAISNRNYAGAVCDQASCSWVHLPDLDIGSSTCESSSCCSTDAVLHCSTLDMQQDDLTVQISQWASSV